MKKLFNTALIFTFLFIVSCAPIPQSYTPIIDIGANTNFNYTQYCQDLQECRLFAEQISPANQAVNNAVIGAVFGAAIGAILGSGSGLSGEMAGIGAGAGGIMGGAHGVGNATERQKTIIKNCMKGRGYKVLE